MATSVLIVGCGFPQLGLLRAARALGLRVIGLDANAEAVGVRECDHFVQASTHDADAIVAAVRQSGAAGLTTAGSEVALRGTADAAVALGMPFYGDPATVERCQSKDLMRAAYASGGAPIPAFLATSELGDARVFAREHGLPIIVKPSRGWGQRGVSKVERDAELASSFAGAKGASSTGVVMVEAFVEGREFSVNAYTLDGVTTVYSVTERIITAYPDPPGITFAEWYPSGLAPDDEKRAIDAAVKGVAALAIRRGPSYTQLRLGPRGAFLVETAYRLGGGLDPDVALLASGVSLFRKILGVALADRGWEASGVEAERHAGAIGKFIVGKPGVVAAVTGLDEARKLPGIVAAEVYVGVGSTVHPLTDGSKRAGHVLAAGSSRADAESRALRAVSTIQIQTVAGSLAPTDRQ